MRKPSLILSTILTAAFLCLGGCSGDDGKDGAAGTPGAPGSDGTAGTSGINCWDLNQNGVADLATEDTDKNGTVDGSDGTGVTIRLDLLIDDYNRAIEDHLTRLQMLDFVL